jgi:hypothetical protein
VKPAAAGGDPHDYVKISSMAGMQFSGQLHY